MLLLVLMGTSFGQTPGTGAISGVVYDPSGRVIPDAEVLAVNDATHLSRSVRTTPEGVFRLPLLPPGTQHWEIQVASLTERVIRRTDDA